VGAIERAAASVRALYLHELVQLQLIRRLPVGNELGQQHGRPKDAGALQGRGGRDGLPGQLARVQHLERYAPAVLQQLHHAREADLVLAVAARAPSVHQAALGAHAQRPQLRVQTIKLRAAAAAGSGSGRTLSSLSTNACR